MKTRIRRLLAFIIWLQRVEQVQRVVVTVEHDVCDALGLARLDLGDVARRVRVATCARNLAITES